MKGACVRKLGGCFAGIVESGPCKLRGVAICLVSLRWTSKILSLAVKNIQANLIFLARLFVSLIKSNILSLTVKNIQVNLIFLARLFVSLHFIVCTYCVWNEKY